MISHHSYGLNQPDNRENINFKQENAQRQTPQPKNVQQEIQIMEKMQQNVERIKHQLKNLLKQEKLANKRIEVIYAQSLKKVEGRITKFNATKEKKAHLSAMTKENQIRKNKIKTIRMEEQLKLRAAKKEVAKCKENEYLIIRQMSHNCDKKMKQYKNEEAEKKKELVQKAKNQRMNYIESVHQSRVMKQKELNQSKLQKSLEKVSVLPLLKKQIESLSQQKSLLQERLNKKKNFNEKVLKAKLHIHHISDDQIQSILKQLHPSRAIKGKASNSPSHRSLNESQLKEQILKSLIIGKEDQTQYQKNSSENQNQFIKAQTNGSNKKIEQAKQSQEKGTGTEAEGEK